MVSETPKVFSKNPWKKIGIPIWAINPTEFCVEPF
jgi:hypothetical protein